MAGNPTTFKQKPRIKNGNTAQTDLKLADYMPVQHEDNGVMTINHISVAQSLCQPVATTPNSTPSGGAYTATCSNYPDFSLTYLDKDGNSHYLIGMKVRVIFTTGITYGSVSGGTYPTLNINGSGAIPLLAQGKTMASGACSAGQSLEFTLIPYGNGVAWDADSNVRESTSDYTIYTDGSKLYNDSYYKNYYKNVINWKDFDGKLASLGATGNHSGIIRITVVGNRNIRNFLYLSYGRYNDAYYISNDNVFIGTGSINVTVNSSTGNLTVTANPNYGVEYSAWMLF